MTRANQITNSDDELLSLLDVNLSTGICRWLPRSPNSAVNRRWNTRWAGRVAGTKTNGYLRVQIRRRKSYALHRLVWRVAHGYWPSAELDHRDGNRSNNAIANLRQAPGNLNACNMKKRANNTTGYIGVAKPPNRPWFHAYARDGVRNRHLGKYKSARQAALARDIFVVQRDGDFAKLNFNSGSEYDRSCHQ